MVTLGRTVPTRLQYRRKAFSIMACFAMLLTAILGFSSQRGTAAEEIPHENYDIASPDLTTVINLLNTSIRASEESLKEFYNETMDEADVHLAMVDSILVPAQQVLSKIEYVASSYSNLSTLLPPFSNLRSEMRSFSSLERDMIDSRVQVMALRDLSSLNDSELVAALRAIQTFNVLLANMNSTIDRMLVSADQITNTTISGHTPFKPNDLHPLIEKLRDMIWLLLEEIEPIIHNDIPWGPGRSFLLLWVENSTVYLGERIVGGGYLYYNGSFRGHHLIHILWDDEEITGTTTKANGTYGFTFRLGLVASLLGEHQLMATARTTEMNLSSDPITITVLLMPTLLTLDVDKREISVNETVSVVLKLEDVRGRPIPNANCQIDYAGKLTTVATDSNGVISRSFIGSDLGFGSHQFSASYLAELPFLASNDGPYFVTVSIPTHIDLELFSQRFVPGYYIVGAGALIANTSQTLPFQRVAIYIDDGFVLNATTDSLGKFALSIPSKELAGGTHTLRVAFDSHGEVWRYCDAELPFLITTLHRADYPFFPFFPGWQTMPPDEIVYLFFGPYAYYVWLFMLVVFAIIVKTNQMRKARANLKKASIVEAPITEPPMAESTGTAAATDRIPDWASSSESPLDPNSRIVWLYTMLIEFLRKKKRITITDDMTHWEVARLLRKLGYPKDSVERVTFLFEKAFYSGDRMSDVDSVGMSVAMDGLRMGGAKDAQ